MRQVEEDSGRRRGGAKNAGQQAAVPTADVDDGVVLAEVVRRRNHIRRQFREVRHRLVEGLAEFGLTHEPLETLHAAQLRYHRLSGSHRIDAVTPMLAILR